MPHQDIGITAGQVPQVWGRLLLKILQLGPCGETGAGLGARGSADPCLPLGASCTGRERSGALGGAHRGSSLRSAGGRAGSSPVLVSTPARRPKYTLALNE